MSGGPLRILACWPYSRRGWVAPLEGLAARGHDVAYLAYRDRGEEPAATAIPAERQRYFWREFRSGHDVVRRVRPDRVVLMGTEGAWQIGTVAAARAAGVPTAVLQHGVYGPTPTEYLHAAPQVLALGSPSPWERVPALRFTLRSLADRPGAAARAVRYLVAATRSTAWAAGPRHPLAARAADAYLVASVRAGRYFMTMDHVGEDRVIAVGLAEFDDLLLAQVAAPPPRSALLIDSPHTGGPHGAGTITGADKDDLLARLGRDLAARGWTLTVKLHPDSYTDDWAIDRPTLRYVRDVDPRGLIEASTVVLGFDSTLLLPALHHRPGLLLHIGRPGWFEGLASSLGATPVAVALEAVTADDVIAAAAAAGSTRAGRARFVAELLGPPDGGSLARIESALHGLRSHD